MTPHEAFAELRSLCQRPHSKGTWFDILSTLKNWPDEHTLLDLAVPYATAHLEHWPHDYKNIDMDAIEMLREGQTPAHMSVFKHLGAVDRFATYDVSIPGLHAHLGEDLDWITESPAMSGITSLNLRNHNLSDEDILAIAQSPHLKQLTHIDIGGNWITTNAILNAFQTCTWDALTFLSLWRTSTDSEVVQHLARAPQFSTLNYLELGQTFVEDDALFAIAKSTTLTNLEYLYLWNTSPSYNGMRALARAPHMAQLKEFEVSDAHLSPSVMNLFVEYDTFNQLNLLTLGNNTALGDHAPIMIAKSNMNNLKQLRLNNINMTDAGFEDLCRSPNARSLEALALQNNPIPNAGYTIGQSEHLSSLTGVSIWNTGATIDSIRAITDSPHLPNLHRLWISDHLFKYNSFKTLFDSRNIPQIDNIALMNCELGPNSFRAIARAPFERLVRLALCNNPMRDTGFKALVTCPAFQHIQNLDIRYCQLTDASAKLLAEHSDIRLTHLLIDNNDITEDGIAALCSSPIVSTLKVLSFRNNNCEHNEACRAIANSPFMPKNIQHQYKPS